MVEPADDVAECHWPTLSEPYASALREAVEWVRGKFDVVGIVASGSIVRGHPDASSDLDLYVIHLPLVRQRIQRFFSGVPAEIFVNPPQAIRRYFATENGVGRPITAHMLATGVRVLVRDRVVDELVDEAKDWLAKPSRWSDSDATLERYLIACLFEDALDVVERDPAAASLLLARCIHEMLVYRCRRKLHRVPRSKDLLSSIAAVDPNLAELVHLFQATASLREQLPIAEALADHVLGVRGFFEWESPLDEVFLGA